LSFRGLAVAPRSVQADQQSAPADPDISADTPKDGIVGPDRIPTWIYRNVATTRLDEDEELFFTLVVDRGISIFFEDQTNMLGAEGSSIGMSGRTDFLHQARTALRTARRHAVPGRVA
jgi:hypothetical protein